jgi:UDP-N-acetylmuramoylalanine--D-glutamate ligase
VQEAKSRGIPLTNDSLEFMRRNPAPMIGITGSAGKTTTTALVGAMSQKSGRTTWIGGNIGRPLIADLGQISPSDLVVQELSSFQLEIWGGEDAFPGLKIAAILNITPNHLDRHKTMDRYRDAKSNILRSQDNSGIAVLAADDPGVQSVRSLVKGRLRLFSRKGPVEDGAFIEANRIRLIGPDGMRELCPEDDIRLRGAHNVANTLAAAVLAESAGIPDEAIIEGIQTFSGVPIALRSSAGSMTFSTSMIPSLPLRSGPWQALAAFDEPIILLAGGRDKNMVWEEWTRQVGRRVKQVVLFGELAEPLARRLKNSGSGPEVLPITQVDTLTEAVYVAYENARPGDVSSFRPAVRVSTATQILPSAETISDCSYKT